MPTFRILVEGEFENSKAPLELQGFYALRFAVADSEKSAILCMSNELYNELAEHFSVPKFTTVKLSVDACNAVPDADFRHIRGFTFF